MKDGISQYLSKFVRPGGIVVNLNYTLNEGRGSDPGQTDSQPMTCMGANNPAA